MSSVSVTRLSPREYLERERKAEFRHEYIDGFVYPLYEGHGRSKAGPPGTHSLLTANLRGEIAVRLRGRTGVVYGGDLRVAVDPERYYTYPDVVLVAGDVMVADEEDDIHLNPTAVIEVLSPMTEADDRGRKFAMYRRLATVQEYVLVSQDRVAVERYARSGYLWVLTDFDDLGATLRLDSMALEVPLGEIYRETWLAGGRQR